MRCKVAEKCFTAPWELLYPRWYLDLYGVPAEEIAARYRLMELEAEGQQVATARQQLTAK